MKNYFLRHLQVFFYTLGQMAARPVASGMTVAVIGISLALPTGLHVLSHNVQTLSASWDGQPQITVFLKRSISDSEIQSLAQRLRAHTGVRQLDHITPQQALAEFQRLSGFGDTLQSLKSNPLPTVFVLHTHPGQQRPETLQAMAAEIRALPKVDQVQLDLEWVQRLQAGLSVVQRSTWLLAGLLALAVLLTIGNTIRLAVLNRREEIAIIQLVGGTNAFIRRPFLYSGLLHGAFGALLAWLLVRLGLWLINQPLAELSALYHSQYRLVGPNWLTSLGLLLAGAGLGWLGARLTVARQLRELDPAQ